VETQVAVAAVDVAGVAAVLALPVDVNAARSRATALEGHLQLAGTENPIPIDMLLDLIA
jgi:hypothetical protein